MYTLQVYKIAVCPHTSLSRVPLSHPENYIIIVLDTCINVCLCSLCILDNSSDVAELQLLNKSSVGRLHSTVDCKC